MKLITLGLDNVFLWAMNTLERRLDAQAVWQGSKLGKKFSHTSHLEIMFE